MKGIDIAPKKFSKEYLRDHGTIIFRDRELVVEEEAGTDKDNTILRFKIGDGKTPYYQLKYASSLYALYPYVCFWDKDYVFSVSLKFGGDE